MRQTITHKNTRIEFLSRSERRRGRKPMKFRDTQAARTYLSRFKSDPLAMGALRYIVQQQLRRVDPTTLTDNFVIEQMAKLLRRRRVYVLSEAKGQASAGAKGKGKAPQPAAQPQPAGQPAKQPTHYAKFRVVDDKTGLPLANIKLKIGLPGGRTVTRTTNADGVVEVRGLQTGGTCSLDEMQDTDALSITDLQ